MNTKYLLRLWLLVVMGAVGGDLVLLLLAHEVRRQVGWLDVRATRPVPDSLKHLASRYLRDSLGVTTERQGDTLLVRLPRSAEREIEGRLVAFRVSSRRLLPWLLAGIVLLHLPLLLAAVITVVWMADRERHRRNRALDAPWGDNLD